MAEFKVIGVREALNKEGKRTGITLFLTENFKDFEVQGSTLCIGYKTRQVFIYRDALSDQTLSFKDGDTVSLDYDEGFQGKAQLVDVHLVKRKETASK